MADQADEDLLIASLSLDEIQRGILQMPEGRKKRDLEGGLRTHHNRCIHALLKRATESASSVNQP
jgi:hypothetical protein